MSERLLVEGMVLSAMPIGEYDKRIMIYQEREADFGIYPWSQETEQSQSGSGEILFAYGTFEIYEGRSSYTVSKRISRVFSRTYPGSEMVYYGFYFLEIAEYYAQENMDERQRLKLLYLTLKVMEKKVLSLSLIKFIYEFKTLVINGEYPNVYTCQVCGKKKICTHLA